MSADWSKALLFWALLVGALPSFELNGVRGSRNGSVAEVNVDGNHLEKHSCVSSQIHIEQSPRPALFSTIVVALVMAGVQLFPRSRHQGGLSTNPRYDSLGSRQPLTNGLTLVCHGLLYDL